MRHSILNLSMVLAGKKPYRMEKPWSKQGRSDGKKGEGI
jgi:hypothetical protein